MDRKAEEASEVQRKSAVILSDRSREIIRLFGEKATLESGLSQPSRSSLSRKPKKRGPFHLVPVMAKATLERLS